MDILKTLNWKEHFYPKMFSIFVFCMLSLNIILTPRLYHYIIPTQLHFANITYYENPTLQNDNDSLQRQCNQPVTDVDPYTMEGPTLQDLIPVIPVSNRYCLPPKFSGTALPKTALACHPGSGTTWTRYLIQQLTGTITIIYIWMSYLSK